MTHTTHATDPRAQCLGKHQYQTPQIAHLVASKAKRQPTIVYRCPHCGFFHTGHEQRSATAKPKLRVH